MTHAKGLSRTTRYVPIIFTVGLATTVGGCTNAPESAPKPTATSSQAAATTSSEAPATPTTEAPPADAELRAAVAQLMMVGVRDFDDAKRALDLGAGGIFIASDTDPNLLTEPGRDIHALRDQVGRPFSVSIDFEGGRVLRHAGILGTFPAPRVMADTKTEEEVRALAQEMATSLAQHGITVNFAPVLDIDAAGLDVVGDRAFSTEPERAARYAAAFAQGMVDGGVTPVFKHFPGHGRASGDSHHNTVTTPPLEELKTFDLAPYAHALPAVPQAAVMMGHMTVPGLGDAPTSLNHDAYELLRTGDYPGGQWFNGVIVTDDLSGMKAISDTLPAHEAAAHAIAAGADQALWLTTDELGAAIDTTLGYVTDGRLKAEDVAIKAGRVAQLQR
ncbi:MAG: glycoside hydrolase family 3 N-terminal domain-containing protein [Corynebacterium sp.]|uniref:glycoside hydrolase family 3 N-terminal domain-containing protein n=1 Tax=Corynebacterium sp. TaxID=1720 RepID=UPI0026DC637E|nr:glycoside hydrolase family 3 N-terminal domain-containing protein [Corynebacterium sp.]MDO5097514.1 glycoside hydrolase family 3 N-terminal domain-containing protein [Corynebacterium sp.]